MSFMVRRDVIKFPVNHGPILMADVLDAYNTGYPIFDIFARAGLKFDELFYSNNLYVFHDVTQEGIEQVTIHNSDSSFAFIRPTGIVMITFRNSNAIQHYEGNGIIHVVTRCGSKRQNRRLCLNSDTLEPHFMNGGECR